MHGDPVNEQIGQWVPASVLVALAAILVRYQANELLRRLGAIEIDLRLVLARLPNLATTEQLGNMGDRLNLRITELAEHTDERVADLRERVKVLESQR